MRIFEYKDEELPEVCIQAELDENYLLIIDEDNVVRENGITYFKRPIRINGGTFFVSVPDQTALVKESKDRKDFFIFALAETMEARLTLRDIFQNEHLREKGYIGERGLPKGWKGGLISLRAID